MQYTAENTYRIPDFKIADFNAAIDKLNRKAAKLGVAPVVVETVAYVEYKVQREPEEGEVRSNKFYMVPATVVAIEGKAPQVEGFEFIARIEYLSDGESKLFHTVPGTDTKIDERFRSMQAGTCEHCNALRYRKDCFVVKETATGEQKQVGRQCLADYTGIHTVENLAARASWASEISKIADEIEEYWSGGMRSYFGDKIDVSRALALTSAYIEAHGWTAKSAATGTPTSNSVAAHFGSRRGMKAEEIRELDKFEAAADEPKHVERAAKVVEWIKGELAVKARSDYELNLVTLVSQELATSKHLGLVCSAVSAYQRAINQAFEYAKRNEANKNSKAVGTVGERVRDLSVEVTFAKFMESQWGGSTLIKFRTEAGDVLTWFASGDPDFEVGKKLKITATVKAHKEYNGIMETQISRVK